jgi:pimeloyl-ACP methyl ester carboxylesterase
MTRIAALALALLAAACAAQPAAPSSASTSTVPVAAASPSSSPTARPTVGPVGAACLTPAEQSGVVRIHSDSGVDLGGVLLGTGTTGVVLAHETHSSLCEWMPFGRSLVAKGDRILAIDLNGLGSSPASPGSPGAPRWDFDVAAAARLLREEGTTRVVLVGSNIGAIASLVAATRIEPPVDGVVVLSAQTEMSGLDGGAAAASLRVPVLYVTSTTDEYLGDMRALDAATTEQDKRLEVVDVVGHGVDLVDPTINPNAAKLRALIGGVIAGR